MIEVTYVLIDRLKDTVELVCSPLTCEFYPGNVSVPKDASYPWGVYTTVQDLDYGQPYISIDILHVDIIHTKFDILQRMVSASLRDLNHENVAENTGLYNAALAVNAKLHDVVCRVRKFEPNNFIEGTDFYTASLDILVQYVKLPTNTSHSLYIGGT